MRQQTKTKNRRENTESEALSSFRVGMVCGGGGGPSLPPPNCLRISGLHCAKGVFSASIISVADSSGSHSALSGRHIYPDHSDPPPGKAIRDRKPEPKEIGCGLSVGREVFCLLEPLAGGCLSCSKIPSEDLKWQHSNNHRTNWLLPPKRMVWPLVCLLYLPGPGLAMARAVYECIYGGRYGLEIDMVPAVLNQGLGNSS